jgi:hypothetical protein
MSITLQPLSEVAVANMAVTVLDDQSLSSLNEDTVLGRFMAREFGFARDELLRRYPWSFAKSRAILAPTSDAPAFGYKYKYNVPTDCLRLLPLRCDGQWNAAPVPYEYESRQVLTDEGPALKIHYIRKIVNASEFDPLFARTLGNYLAAMAAERVTGKQNYLSKAIELYNASMREARLVDSLERGPPEDQYRDDILDVRLAGY